MQIQLPLSRKMLQLVIAFLVLLGGAVTTPTYAQGTDNGSDFACTATAYAPYNSGSKVQGRGSSSGCTGYHTFQVCLVKHNTLFPDQDVQCLSGSGNPPAANVYPTGCVGNAQYFTRVTLDGNTTQSMRVSLNCS